MSNIAHETFIGTFVARFVYAVQLRSADWRGRMQEVQQMTLSEGRTLSSL